MGRSESAAVGDVRKAEQRIRVMMMIGTDGGGVEERSLYRRRKNENGFSP